jgi:antitoxin PrlF
MAMAKLSSKSQIVLPAKLRRKLGIRPGDTLEVIEQGEAILLRKAPRSFVEELERHCGGIWSGFGEELAKEREEWDR